MNKSFKISLGIISCLVIGFLGSLATQSNVNEWYTTLNKPSFNPPNWLFGPVWTLLYIMMGISFGLIWNTKKSLANHATAWFGSQLLLNLSWSFAFFYCESPLGALIIIVLLLVCILKCIKIFQPLSTLAAYLLFPYLFWVSFATILNFEIWRLN